MKNVILASVIAFSASVFANDTAPAPAKNEVAPPAAEAAQPAPTEKAKDKKAESAKPHAGKKKHGQGH